MAAALHESAAFVSQADKLNDDPLRWEAVLQMARSAALRAEGLLRTGEPTDELREQVREVLSNLEQAESDRRLIVGLDEIRLGQAESKGSGFDRRASVPRYAAAFTAWGLDVRQAEPKMLGEQLRGHAQRERLMAALLDWSRLTEDRGERERLEAVLSAMEPSPTAFNRRLREALAQKGAKALLSLAEDEDAARLPVATLVQLARDLRHHGEPEAALRLLESVWKRHPEDFWLNHELGWALGALKPARPEEVKRYWTAAVALRPTSASAHNNLGSVLKKLNQLDEAIAQFKKTIELEPKYANAHNVLGIALADKGRIDEAIVEYKRAIELDPKDAFAHNNLGSALHSKGRVEEAIAEYKKSAELDPKLALPHNNLGGVLYKMGRVDEAIAECKKAVELDPKDAKPHSNLGLALLNKGRVDEAIAECKKAIELDPKSAQPHSTLGHALLDNGWVDEAIAEYRKAIELDPKLANAHNGLGIALVS